MEIHSTHASGLVLSTHVANVRVEETAQERGVVRVKSSIWTHLADVPRYLMCDNITFPLSCRQSGNIVNNKSHPVMNERSTVLDRIFVSRPKWNHLFCSW